MTYQPDLYALVLRLRPQDGGALPAVQGHGLHGLFMELVRQVDPERSNELHAQALSKHFTVAALPRQRGQHSFRGLEMRVTLLQSELFQPVTHALLQQSMRPAMRLGQTSLVLEDVLGTPESHPWAGYSSFDDLAVQVQPANQVSLHFATPTFMTQGTIPGSNKQRLNVLPQPEAVFGSLARRWNDLAPPGLQLPDKQAIHAMCQEVLVKKHRIETVAHQLRKNVQIGFVGQCSYELPADAEQQRVLLLLADAAFYLGVGAKTTQGMGTCRKAD
jgi:CRISPR-associated endoribonuclease Cas6